MQMSGGKAEKVLTWPKQGNILHLGLDKAYGPVSREKLWFFGVFFCFFMFLLCVIKQIVRLIGNTKNASQIVYFSHFVWEI